MNYSWGTPSECLSLMVFYAAVHSDLRLLRKTPSCVCNSWFWLILAFPLAASERFFQRWELQIPIFFSQPNSKIRLNISIASDHRTSAGITYFQLTHNLYWTNLSSCYPLAIPLLSPYYPLTIDLLHFTITYPSPNMAIPYT